MTITPRQGFVRPRPARRPAGRHGPKLAVLLLVVFAAAVLPVTAARALAGGSGSAAVLCARLGFLRVQNAWGRRYVIRNDNFGGRRECLRAGRGPRFTVTRSAADSRGPESLAYPNIFVGCSWGICTPRSGLPERVDRLRRPQTAWRITARSGGTWDAGYDIWIGRRPVTSGQAKGTEIMIWLNTSGFGTPKHDRIIREGHVLYYLKYWYTNHHGVRWPLIIFRRVHPVSYARMRLRPFLVRAERLGLLRPQWYLLSIEAGFEIWRGGRGLATDWFWAKP